MEPFGPVRPTEADRTRFSVAWGDRGVVTLDGVDVSMRAVEGQVGDAGRVVLLSEPPHLCGGCRHVFCMETRFGQVAFSPFPGET